MEIAIIIKLELTETTLKCHKKSEMYKNVKKRKDINPIVKGNF